MVDFEKFCPDTLGSLMQHRILRCRTKKSGLQVTMIPHMTSQPLHTPEHLHIPQHILYLSCTIRRQILQLDLLSPHCHHQRYLIPQQAHFPKMRRWIQSTDSVIRRAIP